MFGEESSPATESGEAAAEASQEMETRVDPDAPGIADGLPPDTANQRHDESLSRRPVTTVRPLEDDPVNAEAPAPEPQASAPPPPIERAPVEPVQAAAAPPAPAPAPEPAPQPQSQPTQRAEAAPAPKPAAEPTRVTKAPPPSAEQNKVLVARGGAAQPEPQARQAAQPAPAAPAAPAQPRLVANTAALDQAAARAYGGVAERPRGMSAHPDALIPGAVVGGPRGGSAPAGGPVVIGGAATSAATPAVSGGGYGGGPVVIGGTRGGVAPAVTGAPATVPGLPAGGEPVAVIQFEFGSSALDGHDRRVLRQVADIQARRGGFIKVVGHSSLFTENMPRDKHMLANFTTSVARAEAVAQALRQEGVPPEVIDVAAVGDREPLYLEVMPSGEAGNRRVEIFLVR